MKEQGFDWDDWEANRRTSRYGLGGSRRGGGAGRRRRRDRTGGFLPRPPLWPTLAVVLGGAVILVSTGALEFQSPLLRSVAVIGNQRVPAAEVVRATGVEPGTKLLDVDPEAIEERLRAHPWIDHVSALRLPPSRLLVSIRERVPVAWLRFAPDQPPRLVDSHGRPFANAEPGDLQALPELLAEWPTNDADAPIGWAPALAVLEALRGSELPMARSLALPARSGDPLRLRLESLGPIVQLDPRDLPAQLERLRDLLRADLPETGQAGEIDLRFADRAVLRGSATPTGDGAPAS